MSSYSVLQWQGQLPGLPAQVHITLMGSEVVRWGWPVLWQAVTDGEERLCKMNCFVVMCDSVYCILAICYRSLKCRLSAVSLCLSPVWEWHGTASLRGKESLHAEAKLTKTEMIWTLSTAREGLEWKEDKWILKMDTDNPLHYHALLH